jgi:hypothetical protein
MAATKLNTFPSSPTHLQSEWEKRDRELRQPRRAKEGGSRSRGLPPVSAVERSFVAVNKQICRTRPVEETLSPQKKTAEAIQQEVTQEVGRIVQIVFGDWHKTGTIDLEAVELLVRDSMHHAGAMAMQRLSCMPAPHDRQVPCGCGQQAR